MTNFFVGLFGLLFVLLLVALVGHGLWVFLAAIFRIVTNTPAPVPGGKETECPRCERLMPPWADECPACGLNRQGPLAKELADLAATARQLERFEKLGAADRATAESLAALILQRKREILGLPVRLRAEPKPLPAPAAPAAPAPMAAPEPVSPPPAVVPPVPAFSLRAVELPPIAAPKAEKVPARHDDDILDVIPVDVPPPLPAAPPVPAVGNGWRVVSEERAAPPADSPLPREVPAGLPENIGLAPVINESPEVVGEQDVVEDEKDVVDADVVEPSPAPWPPTPAPLPPARPPVAPPRPAVRYPAPPPPPRPPRRSLGEVLAAFMEDKNILWGELIGGLLIVGCSVALVISLWQTLEQIPYFPFVIIAGITAALFGAGLYTLHHWKLESTSRGLLVIATLLVPLDFLVLAGLRSDFSGGFLIGSAIVVASMALFTRLIQHAGKVLFADQHWLLPLAVLGPAAGELLASWPKEAPGWLLLVLLGLVPVACQGASVGGLLRGTRRQELLTRRQAHEIFGLLGIATFTVAVALGFVVYRGGDVAAALQHLSPVVALAGIAPLLGGLTVHTRLLSPTSPTPGEGERGDDLAPTRTAGTAVALTAMLVMLLAVALAWPLPLAVVVVCALNCAVLTTVAFRRGLPVAHAAALPCAVLGYLAAVYGVSGPDTSLAAWAVSASSGTALVFLAAGLAVTAEVLWPSERRAHAGYYAAGAGAGAVALFSLALVTCQRADQPGLAMIVYALYGAGGLVLNRRWRREGVSFVALGLLVAATLWGLGGWAPGALQLWGAVVAAEALLLAGIRSWLGSEESRSAGEAAPSFTLPAYLARPLAHTAEWAGVLALVLALWPRGVAPGASFWGFAHIVTGSCLTAVYLLLAVAQRRAFLAHMSGAMVVATVIAATGWAGARADVPDLAALIGLNVAVAGVGLALLSVLVVRRAGVDEPPAWLMLLAPAWRDTAAAAGALALLVMLSAASFPAPGLNAWTLAATALNAVVLAWALQAAPLTWVGSALLLASLCHAFTWDAGDRSLSRSLLLALMTQATLQLLGSLALQAKRARIGAWEQVHPVLAEPLRQSALLASVLAVPLVALPAQGQMLAFAGLVAWLAAFWLAVSWLEHWPRVFTAFQAALGVAVVYAVTDWLEGRAWVGADYPEGLFDPRSLQAYGVGLAVLGLAWAGLRLALPARGTLREMLDFQKPALDELVLGGLVVVQLAVACWGIVPGIDRELVPAAAQAVKESAHAHAYGGGAWLLLALLAVLVVASLWQCWPGAAVLGLALLAVTAPVLTAGPFDADRAAASALRWGLALCFLGTAIPLWLREPLGRRAEALGVRFADSPAAAARVLLLVACVLPVLLLTADVAMLGFAGQRPAGPGEDSFFAHIGFVASNVVPLVLIAGTLVGHALREGRAGYAFAAGLLVDVVLMGGYALGVVLGGEALTDAQVVRVLQLGTLGAAVWALAWLATQRWLDAWREGPDVPAHGVLMTTQVGLGVAGNALLLLGALGSLALSFPLIPPGATGAVYSAPARWAQEAGSLLGWSALGLTAAAVGYRIRQHGWSGRGLLGTLGLLAVAFAACNAAHLSPAAGYRTLMLGWALYALAWAAVALRQAFVQREDAPVRPSATATTWVSIAGGLAAALAIKAAFVHLDPLGAAGALAASGVAGAIMAVGRRREGWAFVAGLGLEAAAMLLVWYFHIGQPLHLWWVYLAQAGCAAAGAGALLWLAARKRLYGRLELRLSSSPLLAGQVALGIGGNAYVLFRALAALFVNPYTPSADVGQVGQGGGWLALLLPMVAGLWYAARSALPRRFFLVAGHALMIGVLAACSASPWDTAGQWLSYHVLTLSWVTAGLLVLAVGVVAVVVESLPVSAESPDERGALTLLTTFLRDAVPQVQSWAEVIGIAVVVLALRGIDDPQRPYWSAGATLAVSLMTAGMALWSRRARHVYESGLLVNLTGCLVWLHGGPYSPAGFVSVNVLCLGVASAFWSALHLALDARLKLGGWRGGALPFRRFAAALGLLALAGLVSLGLISELTHGPVEMAGGLTWAALVAVALAVLITLWDPVATLAGAGLYVVGLTAIGLTFTGQNLSPTEFGWAAALMLAGYVWLASGVGTVLTRWPGLRAGLRLPPGVGEPEPSWLVPAQTSVAAVVLALSVWIALDFAAPHSFLGPVALALLVPAGVVQARRTSDEWAGFLRTMTLALGVLIAAEVGWAAVGPQAAAIWLHRSIALMAALALMTGFYALMPRWLPAPWSDSARRLGPVMNVASLAATAGVLAQEVALGPALAGQIEPWAVAAVALGLVWLIGAGLLFAVMPGRDPFALSERGRTLYVYAGEVLLVLLGLHIKLSLPYLFTGRLAPYQAFVIMAIAFGGVGLAEFFKRRGLTVLSEPLERTGLFLPLLPLTAFWVQLPAAKPGLLPTTHGFDNYAWLWFVAAGFYASAGMLKGSFRYALIAALAANFGLWSLLHRHGLEFLAHPQMWMIPFAVVLLIAEHLNRDRLAPAQAQGLRYLALGLVYVSSTAELFIGGLGQHLWPPIVLMFLAVGGMMLAILLRVRAYLFLGMTFLVFDVLSMVWHAGSQHVWVWWASGIVLGLAILALFALFEKRRDDMLKLLEQIKAWE